MANTIYNWSLNSDENGNSDNEAPWPEGMPPSQVNDSARAVMKRVRELVSDMSGIAIDTGTMNALIVSSYSDFNEYPEGYILYFRSSNTPNSEFTISVNNKPELPVFKNYVSGLVRASQGDIFSDGIYEIRYFSNITADTDGWLLINPSKSSSETGQIGTFAFRAAPDGWLICDGTTYNISDYPFLYGTIGREWTQEGVSDTQFQVPNFKGAFLRGWNDSGTGSPDQNRAWASYQEDALKAHNHPNSRTEDAGVHSHSFNIRISSFNGNGGAGQASSDYNLGFYTNEAGNHSHALNISNDGGVETRPANYPILYCIKT